MEEIHDLIRKLEPAERKLVGNYLDNLVLRNKKDMKLNVFYNFLLKNNSKAPDASQCADFLYGARPDARFRMLKAKLKSRILDALVTDQNIERNNLFDAADLSAIRARKRLSQYYVLTLTRGHSDFSNGLLDEIIRSGLKYENYIAVTEALRAKKYQKGFSKGLEDYQKIDLQIAFYEYCGQAKSKALDFYYKLIIRSDFNAGTPPSKQRKYLEECIRELNHDFKRTRSASVGYFLKLIEFAHNNTIGDHRAAKQSCEELQDIVIRNPSVYKKQRVGFSYDYLAECDINLAEYRSAIAHFREAQKYFPSSSNNFAVSKEAELKTLLYLGELKEAGAAFRELVKSSPPARSGDFRQSRYQFYNATLLFCEGKFREALREITQHLDISKDKSGWEMAVRVLAIQCNIEMQRHDEASQLIENLRKYTQRNKEITRRYKQVVNLLVGLSRKGFVFQDMDKRTLASLEQLSGKDKKYAWQPLGTELLPFHDWLKKKLAHK